MLKVLGGRRYADQSADGCEVTGRQAELRSINVLKKEFVTGLRTVVLT